MTVCQRELPQRNKLKLSAYIQPRRAYLPCSGVGRHANGLLTALSQRDDLQLRLLFSRQHITADGRLPQNAPLRDLRFDVLPIPERLLERSWKLAAWPPLDGWVDGDVDWIFSPMDVRLPTKTKRLAITVHDARVFETRNALERDDDNVFADRKMRFWLRRAMLEADLVFTVSEYSRGRLIELAGLPEEKVVVSGNGLSFQLALKLEEVRQAVLATCDDPSAASTDPPFIVSVGGLRPMKGGHHILAVARAIRRANSQMRIKIAGGPNDAEMVREAATLGNVDLVGYLEDDRLFAELRRATALLFLSLYEGFGLPLVEAMALGCPVICANKTSLPEIAGPAALVFAPEQVDDIVSAIRLVTQPGGERRRLVERGLARAAMFRWENVTGRVVDAMRDTNLIEQATREENLSTRLARSAAQWMR
jgi:glycosyltransferase involved in cell wall biosynthesis